MKRVGRKTIGERFFDFLRYLFLAVLALVTIYPFYNVIVVSLTTEASYINDPGMLYPKEFTLSAYQTIFADTKLLGAFGNSAYISIVGTLYSILLMVCCAYVLTKTEVKGVKLLFGMVIFTMFFTGGMIPTYLNIKNLGLMNSLWAIILPAGINTFYMILLVNAFRDVPAELEESARIDGANEIVILFRVALPLIKPTLMAVLLFGFVDRWNEWYSAMLYLTDSNKWPLTYVLKQMLTNITAATDPATQRMLMEKQVFTAGVQRATIVFTMLPIMCIYPFLQKYFAKGIMVGAIKG